MPRSDTGNLSLASMGLSGKDGNTPSLDDSSVSVTLGDSDDINHLVLSEDGRDRDLLLKELGAEVDLVGDVASVDLNLNDVGLLLTNLHLGHLSVHNGSDDLAVLLSSGDLGGHLVVVAVTLGVLGEGLLLGIVPRLVESTSALITQVLGPDRGQSAKTVGGLGVTDETNANHGRSLQNGHSLGHLLLVQLGAWLLDITEDVSHTGLVAHEGGQVAGLSLLVLGERLDLALEVLRSLSGEETQRTATRMLELSMRHTTVLGRY